jgi:transposase-like protein
MPKNTTIDPQVLPSPKLEKRSRRVFSTEYKLSIIQQAEDCKHGELGGLLRREKLYANQLAQWRREFALDGVKVLQKSQPGPAASKTPEQKRVEQLERENARLRHQLAVKDSCIMLQKKAIALVETLDQEIES